MALEVQNIPLSFSKGVDTKTDSKQVLLGKLLVLENASLKKLGKFIKRPGYGVLASTTTLSNGNAISTFKSELISLNGKSVYSYSEHDDKQYLKGTKLSIDLSTQPIVRNSYEQTQPDSAIHSVGVSVYSWQDSSGGIRYSIFDTVTGQSLVSNGVVSATGTKVKVKTIGTYVLIFFYEGTVLKYFKVDTSLPTSTFAAVTLVTSYTAYFDVQLINGKLIFAYPSSLTATSLFSIDSSLVKSSDYVVTTPSTALSVFGDASNNVWVAYASGVEIKYFITNFGLSSTLLAPTTIDTGIVPYTNVTGVYNGSSAVVFYEVTQDNVSNNFTRKNTATFAGTVGTPADFIRSVGLYAKAFVNNSLVYVVVTHESELQSTYFMVNESGQVVAKVAPSLGGGLSTTGLLAEVNSITSSIVSFAFEFKDFVTSVNGDVTTQTGVNSAFLTFGQQTQLETIGNNLHLSGGIVSMYDGQNVVEKGFNLYPEGVSSSVLNVGGKLKQGNYQYCSIYEWTDSQGQIHRSAPSVGEELDTTTLATYRNATIGAPFVNAPSSYVDFSTSIYRQVAGMKITGGGLTGDHYLTYGDNTISYTFDNLLCCIPNVGTTIINSTFKLTPGKAFRASSTIGSNILTLNREYYDYIPAKITLGSNIVTLKEYRKLDVGTYLYCVDDNNINSGGGLVVSQNNLEVTLSFPTPNLGNFIAPQFSDDNICMVTMKTLTMNPGATVTNGSATITGLSDTSIYSVGDKIHIWSGADTNKIKTLISKTSSTLTFNSVFVQSTNISTTYQPGRVGMFQLNYNYPSVGETFSEINNSGSNSFTTIEVKEVYNDGTIKVNSQASGTQINSTFYTDAAVLGSVTVPTLRVTEKKEENGDASIGIYRTQSNGTVFYRVNPPSEQIINDTTVDIIEYFDSVSDDTLIGNEQLYTTGGELENISPPASSVVGTFKNRLLLRNDEDKLSFWYSKKVQTNTPAEFTDTFTTRVPERGGEIVAFQQLDDKLVIFKEDLIFAQVGDGPAASGINNDFTDPQLITSDSGCVNKKSIVLIPTGLIYQSTKGFYQLDRSLNMAYIGADVEAYNSDTVTSAKLMEDLNQVRFTLSSGKVLVFDYYLSQWDVFPAINAADSTIYSNKFTYILPNGQIRKENATYSDNGTVIPMKIETGWMNLAGLQGFQRIYKFLILGEYKSPHTLTIELFRDFNETAFQTVTIPVLTAPTGKYQFRVFPNIQKMESFKVRITETQPGPTYGEGFELSSLSIEAGIKRGLNKLSKDESFG